VLSAPPVAAVKQPSLDLAHIKGQEHVKRSLEVAAAGGHNVMMMATPLSHLP
jgi:magnesium chelatase family protein